MQRRIDDLEGQRIIYSARLANWQDRAIQDEEVIDQLQTAANENALPDGLTKEYDRLYQSCNYYIARGWIDTVGLRNIGYLYDSYHALGGNGTGTELYNRAKALPIKNSYTEE